jgi:hypothetical protein
VGLIARFKQLFAVKPAEETPRDTDVDTGEIAPAEDTGADDLSLSHVRKLIASFDEDRETILDSMKRWASQGVAILLPIVAVFAVSNEVGMYFSGGRPFVWGDGWAMSMYSLAYACEAGLAALTYSMAAILQKSDTKGALGRFIGLFATWLFFNLGSGVAQLVIAARVLHATDTPTYLMIVLRVGTVCLLDLASVFIFAAFRTKSLTKFLNTQQKKAAAIRAITESELEVQRAISDAERRRREDDLYIAGKERREDLIIRLEEMQAQALIRQAEAALLPAEGESNASPFVESSYEVAPVSIESRARTARKRKPARTRK